MSVDAPSTPIGPDAPDDAPPPGRRQLLRAGAGGLAGAGAVLAAPASWLSAADAQAAARRRVLDLHVNEGFVPMVDGTLVYMRGFGERQTDRDDPAPSLTISPRVFLANGRVVRSRTYPLAAAVPPDGRPGPAGRDRVVQDSAHTVRRRYWASFFPRRTVVAETGSRIRLRVHNHLPRPHRFLIRGVKGADSGRIPPGGVRQVSFPAPAAGTYIYEDPSRGKLERVLGLCGVLVVVPRRDPWCLSAGGAEFERQWLWICHDVDPEWGRLAQAGRTVDEDRTPLLPRYFTLNDRSGIFSIGVSTDEAVNHATHEETIPSGWARATDVRDFSHRGTSRTVVTGQLLRFVNTGIAIHQLHFHGNHVWTLRRNGQDFDRSRGNVDPDGHVRIQQWEDVVELDPMDRKESMLPMKRPPDCIEPVWRAHDGDWHFPMHCHAEMSQSAGGGMYPGGMVADWILAAPHRRG